MSECKTQDSLAAVVASFGVDSEAGALRWRTYQAIGPRGPPGLRKRQLKHQTRIRVTVSRWRYLYESSQIAGEHGYIQTFRNTITGTVFAMIARSFVADRLPMYSRSNATFVFTPSRSVS